MNKIKKYIQEHKYIDILVIICFISLFFVLFSNHLFHLFQDKGREWFLPEQILNGAIPYKDITLIYFPLAYYINAFIYWIAGVSINSLFISQLILCTIYAIAYYFLANNFVGRGVSLLLTIVIIASCVFNTSDCFGYIIPYSFARMYGVFGTFGCIFCIIQLFKQNKLKYAYLASLFTGFSVCCKLEFLSTILILLIGLYLYRKQEVKEYIKIFLSFLIFPIITMLILFIQGVTINELVDSFVFAFKFSHTDAMTGFLTKIGMYPFNIQEKFSTLAYGFKNILTIIVFCIFGLKLKKKYPQYPILTAFTLFISIYYTNNLECSAMIIPYTILFFCLLKFKELKEDRIILFLILSSLIQSQREFFRLFLIVYGTFSYPLLILSLCIIINKFLPKCICEIKIKHIVNFVLVIILLFNINKLNDKRASTLYEIKTNKGTIYTDFNKGILLDLTLGYIERYTKKSDTVLVLPEGNIINFLTNRKVDLHCFMMDRLYHDAYGENEAKNKIENTKSDYIVLIENLNLNNFDKDYLYTKNETQSYKYIYNDYECVKTYKNDDSKISILKKKYTK